MTSVLPPNATPLERALEGASAVDARLGSSVDGIRTAKLVDLPDDWLPWLAWEYGIAEILPYVPDPRAAIPAGLRFQRTRGTPAALRLALGWLGFGGAALEETPPGPLFATYQVDPGHVPTRQQVRDILAVAALAAPMRGRLVRLYHGHDIRPLTLDGDHALGAAMLSDWSGAVLDGVWQSFRLRHGATSLAATGVALAVGHHARWGGVAAYLDRFRVSFSELDGEITPNWPMAASAVSVHVSGPLPGDQPTMDVAYHVPRASVCLSEHGPLGDPNTVLPWRRVLETGEPLRLSDTAGLSDYIHRIAWTPVDALSVADTALSGTALGVPATVTGQARTTGSLLVTRQAGALVLSHQAGAPSGQALAAPAGAVRSDRTGLSGGAYTVPWAWAPWGGPSHGTVTAAVAAETITGGA